MLKQNKFSLIIGTFNRCQNLEECLKSISKQKYRNFEVIVVDQNKTLQTKKVVDKFNSEINIKYIHTNVKGLSHARNMALSKASGSYVCLIDDDAIYSPNYLNRLNKILNKLPGKIINGKIWNPITKKDFVNYSSLANNKKLSLRQIIRNCPSPGLTIPMKVFEELGGFDENFGVGAEFGAGEETDILLRAYLKGYKVYYCDQVKLKHPFILPTQNPTSVDLQKIYNYSIGISALYIKYIKYNGFIKLLPLYFERQLKARIKVIVGNSKQRRESKYQLLGNKVGVQKYIEKMNKTKKIIKKC